VVLLANPSEE